MATTTKTTRPAQVEAVEEKQVNQEEQATIETPVKKAKKVKYLTVDVKKKTITINEAGKPNAQDEEDIDRYLRAGYRIHRKSAERVRVAKENALTDAEIQEALKDDEEALAHYLAIKSDKSKSVEGKRMGGFFNAKKWYKTEYIPSKAKK